MAYQTVVFDLDGTLLDTSADLVLAVNHALASRGLPERTAADVMAATGNGIAVLIAKSVPAGTPEDVHAQVFEEFKRYYAAHAMDHTLPYPGIPELVERLRAAGAHVAVVSNKADFAVQEIIDARMPGAFDAVLGECMEAGIAKKPAPDMVEAVLARLGLSREGLAYVGDSEVDIATAANCHCPCISVSWGFRSRDELIAAGAARIVDTPYELESVLLG